MKKMTLKPIIMSALAALAFGTVTVGTTFALFTDKAETKINVQSGKVDVNTETSITGVWEYDGVETSNEKAVAPISENNYVNSMGGTTKKLSSGVFELDRWAPGDRMRIQVNCSNLSNVKTKMRLKVVMQGDLADALTLKVYRNGFDQDPSMAAIGKRTLVTEWADVEAGVNPDNFGVDVHFVNHGTEITSNTEGTDNQYQDKSANIIITYEAVQGNAVTDDILERINTKLSSEAITEGKNDTMFDALADLSEEEKSAVENRGYVWHQDKDAFYDFASTPEDAYKYFMIYDSMPSAQTYSIYAKGANWAASVADLKVGFDVGEITTFTSISYDRSAESSARNIKIRTNAVTTAITLNGYVGENEGDDVRLYGLAGEVNVIQVGGNSLHTYGKVGFIKMQKGHLVVENNSDVHTVLMAPSENAVVVIDKAENGELDHAHAANQAIAESNITNGGNVIVDYDNDEATTKKHPGEVVTEEELKTEGKQAFCPHAHDHYIEDPNDAEKHYKVCDYCGKQVSESTEHFYDAENVNECIHCGHNNTIVVYNVSNTASLSEAISNYNNSESPDKNYVIELADGIYEVDANFYDIDQTRINSGSTLTIKAKNMPTSRDSGYKVTIVPRVGSVTGNGNKQYIFKVSGGSGYANGGPINIEGIKFDFANSAFKTSTYDGQRLNIIYCDSGVTGRYAHEITLDNCYLNANGGKLASFVSANNGNSSPRDITINNCYGNKINCFANAYGTNFTIKDCTANEMLCIGNFQTNGYSAGNPYTKIATIDNVDGSFFGQFDNHGDYKDGGTENGVIYSIGGEFDIKNCDITTSKGKGGDVSGIFDLKSIIVEKQYIHTEAKVSISNSTFNKGTNVYDILVNTETVVNIGDDSYNAGHYNLA